MSQQLFKSQNGWTGYIHTGNTFPTSDVDFSDYSKISLLSIYDNLAAAIQSADGVRVDSSIALLLCKLEIHLNLASSIESKDGHCTYPQFNTYIPEINGDIKLNLSDISINIAQYHDDGYSSFCQFVNTNIKYITQLFMMHSEMTVSTPDGISSFSTILGSDSVILRSVNYYSPEQNRSRRDSRHDSDRRSERRHNSSRLDHRSYRRNAEPSRRSVKRCQRDAEFIRHGVGSTRHGVESVRRNVELLDEIADEREMNVWVHTISQFGQHDSIPLNDIIAKSSKDNFDRTDCLEAAIVQLCHHLYVYQMEVDSDVIDIDFTLKLVGNILTASSVRLDDTNSTFNISTLV